MRDYGRYIISVIFVIAIIVLIVIGFLLIRNILSSDSATDRPSETRRNIDLVEEGKAGKPVRYTINGNVVGNEEYRSVRITVDRSSRLAEIIRGYEGEVIESQRTANNQNAYDAFIAAIASAGFAQVNNRPAGPTEAAACPLGQTFNYEVAPGMDGAFRSWSTSCGNRQGTFNGSHQTIDNLFKRQIPNYGDFTQNVRFNGYTN
jgi:uncharacterized membrane protein